MNKANPNDAANPTTEFFRHSQHHDLEPIISGGLTKREYFAAAAMQGLLACSIAGGHKMPQRLVREALVYVEEMFEALNKEDAPTESSNHRVHFTGGVYTVERKDGEKWAWVADFADIHEVTKHYPNAIPKTGGTK